MNFNLKKVFRLLLSSLLVLAIVFLTFFYIKGPKNYAKAESSLASLPNTGIVIFTFDDTYKSTYTKAYPILKNKNYRGMAYVSPYVVGLWKSKMTASDLAVLNGEGWDVSSHGYTHINPTTLTATELDDHLRLSHDWLLAQGFTKGARHYASPNGGCDSTVTSAAQKYYQTMRINGTGCGFLPSGYTYIAITAHDAISWDNLVKKKIDNLKNNTQVLFLAFHDVVDADPVDNQTSLARFNQVVDYVTSKNINVLTLSDLVDQYSSYPPTETPTPTPTETPTPTPTETPTLTPTSTPIPEIIIDNLDSGFSTVGTWQTYSNSSLLQYNTNFVYLSPGSGSKKAIFTPSVTTTGNYQVFVWWPKCWVCATNATYTITYSGGTSTVAVNLSDLTKAGQWISLGTYPFNSGTSGNIMITDNGNGRVTADAIKLISK